MEKLLELLGITGTGLAFSFAVLALFWKGDDAISEEFRKDISNRLLGITAPTQTSVNWATIIVKVFDRLFKFGRIPSFSRSSFATFLAILVLIPLISNTPWHDFFGVMLKMGSELGFTPMIDLLPIFVVNFVADYISLIESRIVLTLLERRPNNVMIILLLIADLLLTAAIWVICFAITVLLRWETYTMEFTLIVIRNTIMGGLQNPFIFAFFFTTFLTSFWIWLYLMALAVFRLSLVSTSAISFLKWALPIEEKPIRSIGQVAFLIIFIPFFVIETLRVMF